MYKTYTIKLASIQDIDDLLRFLKEASALVDIRVLYTNNHCSWSDCDGDFPPENEIKEIQFFKKISDSDYFSNGYFINLDDDDLIAVLEPDLPYYLYTREVYDSYIKNKVAYENQKERILEDYADKKSYEIICSYYSDDRCASYSTNDCVSSDFKSLMLEIAPRVSNANS